MEFTKETNDILDIMIEHGKAEQYQVNAFKESLMDYVNKQVSDFVFKQHPTEALFNEAKKMLQADSYKFPSSFVVKLHGARTAAIHDILEDSAPEKISDSRGSHPYEDLAEKLKEQIKESLKEPAKVKETKKYKHPLVKTEIFDLLQKQFGLNETFRHKDLLIAILMTKGVIDSPSEYSKRFRGYYSCPISQYSGLAYFYNGSKREPRYLIKHSRGVYSISK